MIGDLMAKRTSSASLVAQYRKLQQRKDFRYSALPGWQRTIIQKYPDIYLKPSPTDSHANQNQPLAKDYCNLRSGFECGPGWNELIERLSAVANELVIKLINSGLQRDASIKPMVIKQKLGALRWQGQYNLCSPFDELWLAYLGQIGRESLETCEMSGEPGSIRRVGGFVICLAENEYRKWKESPHKQRAKYWQVEGASQKFFANPSQRK